MVTGIIEERGSGFAAVGDYVTAWPSGDVYEVTAIVGQIHTGPPGTPNYVHAEFAPADWDDLTDEEADAIVCTASMDDDDDATD